MNPCSPSCLHMFWSEPPPNSSKGTGWMPNLFHTVWRVRQFFGIHWFWSDYVRFEISPAVSVKIEAPHLQGKVTRVDPSMAIVRLFWEAPPGQRAAASSRWFMDIYGDLMNLIDDIWWYLWIRLWVRRYEKRGDIRQRSPERSVRSGALSYRSCTSSRGGPFGQHFFITVDFNLFPYLLFTYLDSTASGPPKVLRPHHCTIVLWQPFRL